NYHQVYDAFVDWLVATALTTPVHNPLPVLRWNSHKRYLHDLERAGLPVVPTEFVNRGADLTPLPERCAQLGWSDIVIKPAISGGSFATWRSTVETMLDD